MIPEAIKEVITLQDGRIITLETGKLAKQADGSVLVRMNDTLLLATVVANKTANEGIDFLPLTIDYREKYAANGRFPGGFFKREARPSDDEILTMRLVDRVLRPLFPNDYHAEVQVMISLISYDGTVAPEGLAGLAASAAIALTDIPFDGPISEVRVIRLNGEFMINPSNKQAEQADIDMVIGASMDSVVMVEGEMKEVSEEDMVATIAFAHEAIKIQIQAQINLAAKISGVTPKRVYEHEIHDAELKTKVQSTCFDALYAIAKETTDKQTRSEKFDAVLESFKSQYTEEALIEKSALIKTYFYDTKKEAVRQVILNDKIRLDGRSPEQIRPIWCEVDYLPRAHGSAVFTRGETQSLTTVTFGTSLDANKKDGVSVVGEERFYLHYNFPPFSTGEARPLRGTSRREVGHGNLAQRALKNMIPSDFPYTLRVVSDILESNGSSSMATVCAGTLALMDAGVAIPKPVSGIAMGLITDSQSGKWTVLSDILGDEDHLGDMDFKVTGTKDGITACQMDIKIKGLSYDILTKALHQAKEGRLHILGEMQKTLDAPRSVFKPHAPKLEVIMVANEFIGAIIGPGGKIIQELQKTTGTTITIEEVGNQGRVEISGVDPEQMTAAINAIKAIVFIPEVGAVYPAKVVSIKPFGAFVSIGKGIEGLLHISEIDHRRLETVEEALTMGQEIEVKVIGIDEKTKKFKLSRKVLLPKEA